MFCEYRLQAMATSRGEFQSRRLHPKDHKHWAQLLGWCCILILLVLSSCTVSFRGSGDPQPHAEGIPKGLKSLFLGDKCMLRGFAVIKFNPKMQRRFKLCPILNS